VDCAAVGEELGWHDAGIEDPLDGPIQEDRLGARLDARLAVVVEHVRRQVGSLAGVCAALLWGRRYVVGEPHLRNVLARSLENSQV
jgi:hypothetical protein